MTSSAPLTLRDGTETQDPRLDRIVSAPDWGVFGYGIAETLTVEERTPRTRLWQVPAPVLDQGQEGECVQYGICHDLRARPKSTSLSVVEGILADDKIYHRAQHLDEWRGCGRGQRCTVEPSNFDYEGTSVHAGMKALVELGLADEYRWGWTLMDLILSVGWRGPSVIGVNWYEKMFAPDARGFLHADGPLMGGHCLLVIGVAVSRRYFTLLNSWGPDWGRNGRAKISFEDMERLIQEDGEVVIPLGLAKAA